MTGKKTLFGRPIVDSSIMPLVDQVHDVFCEEIHAGRWKVDDRLPGVATIVEQSGLSHGVVQRALVMLREEGYLRQEERRGTFLKSILPDGRRPLGAIGVAMLMREDESYRESHTQYLLKYQHAVIQGAAARNYTTEVIYLHEGDDWNQIDRRGGRFSDQVKGIVSLYPFLRHEFIRLPPDRIPLVFEFFPYDIDVVNACAPFVGGETTFGIRALTEQVVAAGHRNIIPCIDKGFFPDTQWRFALGMRTALELAGLPFSQEACDASLQMQGPTPGELRAFVRRFPDATAVVCSSAFYAQEIISCVENAGLRVPEDLTVVGFGEGPARRDQPTARKLTGTEHDMARCVEIGFDVLFEQMRDRRNHYGHISVKSHYVPGDTLGPPREARLGVLGENKSHAHG